MGKAIYNSKYRDLIYKLRAQRVKAGLLQVDLAEILDVSQANISKWERAESRLDIIELLNYCKAIGITNSDLCKYIKELKIL